MRFSTRGPEDRYLREIGELLWAFEVHLREQADDATVDRSPALRLLENLVDRRNCATDRTQQGQVGAVNISAKVAD
jgi:hypothetical protein